MCVRDRRKYFNKCQMHTLLNPSSRIRSALSLSCLINKIVVAIAQEPLWESVLILFFGSKVAPSLSPSPFHGRL